MSEAEADPREEPATPQDATPEDATPEDAAAPESPPAEPATPPEPAAESPPSAPAPAPPSEPAHAGPPWARWVVTGVLGAGGMALLMAWLAGAFHAKVQPGPRERVARSAGDARLIQLEAVQSPLVREVTGSIAAEHETRVASQLLARVEAVHVNAGQRVEQGALLVTLAEAELRNRLEQAQARLTQAKDRFERIERQHAAQAATEAQLVQARADRDAAAAALEEAETFLKKTEIRAPVAGVLIERLCEVGDTVTPGQPVARLYDRLQLIATVPESLQPRLHVGDAVEVSVPALGKGACSGTITEIVPQAQALSRSFQVKVSGPCPAGLIPGMFGRMRIPLGERSELLIPQSALRRVGQVTLVFRALPSGELLRQFVHLGEVRGELVVVTGGLQPGDRIVADVSQLPAAEASR